MAKKFDLVDFGEDKATSLAEIMTNKKCKKILDYLKEKEASETDISKDLDMPLSTVDYNLQKLLKNGLVEIKDFYWSPKGNKVYIYKATDKVLVFSHKKSKHIENRLRIIIPVVIIASLLLVINLAYFYLQDQSSGGTTSGVEVRALWSFKGPSQNVHITQNQGIFEPVPLMTNGENTQLTLEFELLKVFIGDKIKLEFEEGIKYIEGPFVKEGEDYFIFLDYERDPKEDLSQFPTFSQFFTIEVIEKGKHSVRLTVLDENNKFVETRFLNICVADTIEDAISMCTTPRCNPLDRACILEGLKQEAVKES